VRRSCAAEAVGSIPTPGQPRRGLLVDRRRRDDVEPRFGQIIK
jgi:hypothetical protein